MSEYTANLALESAAAERAGWSQVLARPATQRPARMVRRVSLLARIFAMFA